MKKAYYIPFLCACLTLLLAGCHRERNARHFATLTRLDSIAEINPNVVADSLKELDTRRMSSYNRGYYRLVDAVVKDKNYYAFTSDSLIRDAVRLLARKKEEHPLPYARALMYSGIVRYRMGITDSTAYNPLKDALAVMEEKTPYAQRNISLTAQYLGVLHDVNQNKELAYRYLNQSLAYAKQINKENYMFVDYRELAWNRLGESDLIEAKAYIDTIKEVFLTKNLSKYQEDYDILLAAYYESNKEYRKAIQMELELLKSTDKKDSISLYKAYHRLFTNYKGINDLENSYRYAELTTRYLPADTAQYLSFLAFKDLGETAYEKADFKTAATSYAQAYALLNKSIEKQLDKKILELEKRYDYTQVEIKRVKAEKRSFIYSAIAVGCVLLIFVVLLLFNRQRIRGKNARLLLEKQHLQKEVEAEKLRQETIRKNWVNTLYQYIADQSGKTDEVLYKLKLNKLIQTDENLNQLLEQTVGDYVKNIKSINQKLLDDNTFMQLTGISKEQSALFTDSEKLLLALSYCNLSNKQIAVITHSTYDSIRVRRKNLSKKIEQLNPHSAKTALSDTENLNL